MRRRVCFFILMMSLSAGLRSIAAENNADAGKKELEQSCQLCHSLRLIESQRLSTAAWQKEVDKMIGWGAVVHDKQALLRELKARHPEIRNGLSANAIKNKLYAIVRRHKVKARDTVEFLTGTNGFFAPENGAAVGAFEAAIKTATGRKAKFLNATGVSDGRYYADDAIEIINFGPGSGAQGHAANESVPIDEMVEAAHIQLDVVRRLTGIIR